MIKIINVPEFREGCRKLLRACSIWSIVLQVVYEGFVEACTLLEDACVLFGTAFNKT